MVKHGALKRGGLAPYRESVTSLCLSFPKYKMEERQYIPWVGVRIK